MDIERLKCKRCGKFPDGEVVQCTAKEHIVCVSCMVSEKTSLCVCGAKLSEKRQRNPIEQLLQHAKTSCRYEGSGCTWQFTATEMDSHVQECKFRPYRCITSTLNVLKCDWIGLQHEIEKHLLEEHKELGPVFRFRESSSLVFCDNISIGGLKLVDAFSKHFLFYFFSDVDRGTISFLMIYFGRHEESDQYCYELEIRSLPIAPPPAAAAAEQSTTPTKDAPSGAAAEERPALVRSIKFVERCYSDSENLTEVIEDERCIALSHQQVRNYLHKGKLYFTFKVRKVSDPGRERNNSESAAAIADTQGAAAGGATGTKPKPKPPPFVFANKGKAATNTKRSGGPAVASSSSSSSSKSGSGGGGGGLSRQNSSSPNGNTLPSPSPSVSRPPSYASTVNVGSQGQQLTTPIPSSSRNSGCSSYSSINKVVVVGLHSPFEIPEHCPLMTPSINKHDVPPTWMASERTKTTTSTYQITQLHRSYSLNQEVYHDPAVKACTRNLVSRVAENTPNHVIQPYKVKDDRYLLRYPTNCLSKPQQKR
ncbi:uncharacterized protein LOC126575636 [Anopheles aquasalis]|uniref:uncharacterized protein LOC126575636 n=1 Tax=Anopheles aquasalis TaxID=42839 RepID=UPI00215B7325|nr:uncharacterized protein LOC126575636 [Anopheles aquasalis]XP_050092389.1 uncharacterized protein LOC126575636 [Anopheles aquasalis]XP_050092391.1 uncharacterized protein LOC126575636 [Anopheles aquasalis]